MSIVISIGQRNLHFTSQKRAEKLQKDLESLGIRTTLYDYDGSRKKYDRWRIIKK